MEFPRTVEDIVPVNPAILPSVASSVLVPVGNVYTPVSSAAVNDIVLFIVSVLPSISVRVAPLAGCVRVILFIVVAVAAPRVGVVKVGEVSRTTSPVPFQLKREDVATAVGVAVLPVRFPMTELAARVANMPSVTLFAPIVVVFPTEETSPERLAFVVTVAALPSMLVIPVRTSAADALLRATAVVPI